MVDLSMGGSKLKCCSPFVSSTRACAGNLQGSTHSDHASPHVHAQTMYKAAQMELAVLHKLGQADHENRKHCIRLLRYFEYRHHMCLVSACLWMYDCF